MFSYIEGSIGVWKFTFIRMDKGLRGSSLAVLDSAQ